MSADSPRHRTAGALATKPRAAVVAMEDAPPREARLTATPNFARAVQGDLFPAERPAPNVIPIARPAQRQSSPRTQQRHAPPRRTPRVVEGQGQLDFVQSAPVKPRTLSTTVEASIYCEAPVATPLHRAVAAAIDIAMVFIAYGLFLAIYRLFGGAFAWNKINLLVFSGSFLVLSFAYGAYYSLACTETAGMRWTQLRLITFDGYPPEPHHRFLRFAGACISRCTVLGLLWSLADEESLTWQDHISRTFPTPVELESSVFRRR